MSQEPDPNTRQDVVALQLNIFTVLILPYATIFGANGLLGTNLSYSFSNWFFAGVFLLFLVLALLVIEHAIRAIQSWLPADDEED
jgi:hypothetical protein